MRRTSRITLRGAPEAWFTWLAVLVPLKMVSHIGVLFCLLSLQTQLSPALLWAISQKNAHGRVFTEMLLPTLTQDVAARNVRVCGFITCCRFFWCVARGTGVVVGVRVLGNSGGATVIAVFMWCDSVRFEETCSRAPKIFWQAELNVKAPWSWIVQTSFHQNDLYAAGTCTDEMPFSSVLYSSGVQQATSALQIACIKCLHCCPQPQLVVGKCRSRAPHTSECHLFIFFVEGNNAAGNTLNEMKSGHRKQAGT